MEVEYINIDLLKTKWSCDDQITWKFIKCCDFCLKASDLIRRNGESTLHSLTGGTLLYFNSSETMDNLSSTK